MHPKKMFQINLRMISEKLAFGKSLSGRSHRFSPLGAAKLHWCTQSLDLLFAVELFSLNITNTHTNIFF